VLHGRLIGGLCACLLGACAARDPLVAPSGTAAAGNWRIETQVDRITGAPIESALLTAPSSHSSQPFPKRVTMQLACFNKQPIVRFAFEVNVATTRSNEFGYRFDDKPGREITARFLGDDKVAVIDNGADVTQFVNELAAARTLYLRIRSLSFGRTTAEVDVEGAPAAIAATVAHCPAVIKEDRKKPRR
jgi:hypothetical protein